MSGIATLVVVSAITFAATNLTGTDPARAALGRLATPQQVEYFRKQQGLDKPAATRYFVWIGHAVTGNWGISLQAQEPVTTVILPRAARSAILALASVLISIPLAFVLGGIAAQRPGGRVDTVLSLLTLFVIGLPEFVVGLVLLYVFAVRLDLLPPDSTAVSYGSFHATLLAYALPVMTLTALLTPYSARMVRAAVREVLAAPYIQSAALRGVSGGRMYLRHVVPNALGPVVNVVALSLAEVLVGVVVVENVFAFPGLGALTVYAVSNSDFAVVQAAVLLAAGGFVALNFLADALVVLVNPRLRRSQG